MATAFEKTALKLNPKYRYQSEGVYDDTDIQQQNGTDSVFVNQNDEELKSVIMMMMRRSRKQFHMSLYIRNKLNLK
jgi:hypothetical protein